MKQEIKDKWVAALRSGDYRQTHGKLAKQLSPTEPMGHCCLGVLCELAIEDGVPISREAFPYENGVILRYGPGTNGFSDGQLPGVVATWAGLEAKPGSNRCDPKLYDVTGGLGETFGVSCAEANDGYQYRNVRKHTFSEIADLIEENL